MKKSILTYAAALLVIFTGKAQENNAAIDIGMKENFKEFAKNSSGRLQSGFEAFQTYSTNEIKGSQFFYPTWATGSVVTSGNETISNKYLFIFDRVRQELFIKQKIAI